MLPNWNFWPGPICVCCYLSHIVWFSILQSKSSIGSFCNFCPWSLFSEYMAFIQPFFILLSQSRWLAPNIKGPIILLYNNKCQKLWALLFVTWQPCGPGSKYILHHRGVYGQPHCPVLRMLVFRAFSHSHNKLSLTFSGPEVSLASHTFQITYTSHGLSRFLPVARLLIANTYHMIHLDITLWQGVVACAAHPCMLPQCHSFLMPPCTSCHGLLLPFRAFFLGWPTLLGPWAGGRPCWDHVDAPSSVPLWTSHFLL